MGGKAVGPEWVLTVDLPPPSLNNNTADADRLADALKQALPADAVRMDLPLIRALPQKLRKHHFRVRCVVFKGLHDTVLTAVLDPEDPLPVAGLALDIGTTTVFMRLVDLETRTLLGEIPFSNPQGRIGPDVLTRILYAETDEGLFELNRLLMEALNRHIHALCAQCGIDTRRIFLVSVAGNTAMTHLFLGLCPGHLIREPYIPAVNRIPLLFAGDLGLGLSPEARVYVFPNIGSYFGGDLFAGILFSGLHEKDRLSLLVDVGTNAEVVLGTREWFMACAGAAGPALEGGVTRMGMPAGPGVIDKVTIDSRTRRVNVRTIGNHPPKGICGSGLIDLAAQLFRAGMIDIQGKWIPAACGERLVAQDGEWRFVLVPARETAGRGNLTLTQADLDSLMRSKAAMYTILETLTQTAGVSFEEIEAFYVAGTFGSVIDPESAITLGMLPDLPRDRFHVLGNSAIGGAVRVLFSRESTGRVAAIRDRTTYLELNVNQEFMNRFSAARFIPHTDISRFPSVTIPPPPHPLGSAPPEGAP